MVKMYHYGVIKFISRMTTDYILCLVMIYFSAEKIDHFINQIGITKNRLLKSVFCV